jgi:histidinol-phosphatase (PHP family)
MNRTFDMHVHSSCSGDGKASLREMCASALANGLRGICFTEHCDFNPLDSGYLFYNHMLYSNEINAASSEFGDRLEILQGIEFSEPHRHPKEFESAMRGMDFVLASVHWVGDHLIGDPDFLAKHSPREIGDLYYGEIMETVKLGGFDSLAHLDQPKRYLGLAFEPIELVSDICSELVKRDLCLEMNSSPLRKGMDEIYQSDNILTSYCRHGGRTVTLGSDAHDRTDIIRGFDTLQREEKEHRLAAVIFRHRKLYYDYVGAADL